MRSAVQSCVPLLENQALTKKFASAFFICLKRQIFLLRTLGKVYRLYLDRVWTLISICLLIAKVSLDEQFLLSLFRSDKACTYRVMKLSSIFTVIKRQNMPAPSNSPIVTLLKEAVEKKFGRPIKTPKDFLEVVDFILNETHELISDTTIRRLYKKGQEYPNVSDDILNILSRCVGFNHFKEFSDYITSAGIKDSELSVGINGIKASDLCVGDRVYIAWRPDRQCSLKYLGGNRFEVDETENASISKGDTFTCTMLVEGRCLYVDNLVHDGEIYESYAMGKVGGLTCVKRL